MNKEQGEFQDQCGPLKFNTYSLTGFHFSSLKYQGQINFVNVYHGPNANSVLAVEVKTGVLPAWKYVHIWDRLVGLLYFMAPSIFSAVHSSP